MIRRRSVTRLTLASPIYWALIGALVAGMLIGPYATWWIGTLAAAGCAALAGAIDRWYVTARAKALVTVAIKDAVDMHPETFAMAPPPRVVCVHGHQHYCGHCGPVPGDTSIIRTERLS